MSDYPEEFLAHLGREVTTLCHCWRVTRQDGVVLGFTDHDLELVVAGDAFEPQTGFTASEARDSLGLAADMSDVAGALSSDRISEADIAAGRYDGSTVETLLVNWREPAQHALLRSATIGKIVRRDGSFSVELESLEAKLDQVSGRHFRKGCDAELGDARCGFSLATPGFSASGTVNAIETPDGFAESGLAGFADGWFSNGMLTWTSGASSGRRERIAGHRLRDGEATLTLWRGAPAALSPGDAFTLVAGCDKSFATCKAKFNNALNFQGFPHMPGNDAAYGYVSEGQKLDGGPIVP
ncbi:MAG: DUF2163 domain-containing protein [Mesorhizobium sp.]|nr:DUF2163 domain-containing protein [Mesorhizobium sp.]